jgi:hypothetical protein
MRRLVSSLIATCGIALLAACTGGGYGLTSNLGGNSKSPDSLAFMNGSGSVNDFFVSPTASAPVQVSAVGYKGLGLSAVIIPDLVFTWNASYSPAGTTYFKGASPNGFGTCGTPPGAAGSPAPGAILVQVPPGTYAGYTAGTPMATIFVQPSGQPSPATTGNYCMFVNATETVSGRVGSVTVVVSQAP